MHSFGRLGVIEMFALAAVILLFVQPWKSRRRRQWEHDERMKALELGAGNSAQDMIWPRALVCIAIGAFVPVGVFFCAFLMRLSAPDDMAIQGTVWGVAFLVSTVAIGCGTALAFVLLGSRSRPEEAQPAGKPPAFDPESFEIANHHHR